MGSGVHRLPLLAMGGTDCERLGWKQAGQGRPCWSGWEIISLKSPKQPIKSSLINPHFTGKETEAQRENLLPKSGAKPPNASPTGFTVTNLAGALMGWHSKAAVKLRFLPFLSFEFPFLGKVSRLEVTGSRDGKNIFFS